MADNITISSVGGNVVVAADDISSVYHQRIKMGFGVDGSYVDASSTDPLPVTAPAATRTTHSIAAALQTDSIMSGNSSLTPKFFTETVAASDTDEELVALVATFRIRVIALVVHVGATATTVTFESSTTTRIHKVPAGANGGQVLPFNPAGWFQTAVGESLTCTTGAGSSVEISGVYVEVP